MGQANVMMAVLHEWLVRGNMDVHIASFKKLETRINLEKSKIDSVQGSRPVSPTTVTFHAIQRCEAMVPALLKRLGTALFHDNKPGFVGAWKSFTNFGTILIPWTPDEMADQISQVEQLIETVQPDLVVVDPLYLPARDACKLKDQNTVLVSPLTVKEHVAHAQGIKALWVWGG